MLRLILTSTMIWSMSLVASAQIDTIKFKNGTILPTTIDSVNSANEIIYYQQGDAKHLASFAVVERYFFHGQWHGVMTTIEPKVKHGFKGDYIDLTNVDWRVYTNVSGLFNMNDLYYSGFQASKLISIEPEYIKGNWAFKFPLQIGIDYQSKLGRKAYNRNNTGYWYYNEEMPFNHMGSSTYFDGSPTEDALPDYSLDAYYWSAQGHFTNTRVQIGVYPKYYIQGHRKRSYYLTGGLNWGIGDYGAVTYYETFSYTDESGKFYDDNNNYRDGYKRTWTLDEQIMEVEENTFEYFRAELLLGLEFNILKAWSLNFEYGLTTVMNNKGMLEDLVYARNQNQEFERVLSYTYRPRLWDTYVPVGNIQIGYSFQKKK